MQFIFIVRVGTIEVHIANPTGVTMRDNTLIVRQFLPNCPQNHETEVYRFRDAFIAREAYDAVHKAIREGWEAVNLRIDNNRLTAEKATVESLKQLPTER